MVRVSGYHSTAVSPMFAPHSSQSASSCCKVPALNSRSEEGTLCLLVEGRVIVTAMVPFASGKMGGRSSHRSRSGGREPLVTGQQARRKEGFCETMGEDGARIGRGAEAAGSRGSPGRQSRL